MSYIKPFKIINESAESQSAYNEWSLLKTKINMVFNTLGIECEINLDKTYESKTSFPKFTFILNYHNIPYSILSIIYCVAIDIFKSDSTDIIENAKSKSDDSNTKSLYIGIFDDAEKLPKNIYVINPKSAKEAYELIINYINKKLKVFNNSYTNKENSDLISRYLELNKNFDSNEAITDDFIINNVITAAGNYKNSYNVIKKLKERNIDLYNKMVKLNPEIIKSDNLSGMGFGD
jgi:hypothetical protein